LSIVLFWAQQYYTYSKDGGPPKKTYVIIYWVISVVVGVLTVLLSILMIFFVEFDINNDIYRVMRLVLRFVLTLMIVFGLLFYGTGLFARIKSLNLNVADKKVYMKVG
jgi:hypothetical protein